MPSGSWPRPDGGSTGLHESHRREDREATTLASGQAVREPAAAEPRVEAAAGAPRDRRARARVIH